MPSEVKVGMLVLAIVLLGIFVLSASWLGVGESERESKFRWRARRRPGIKPCIWGMGKYPELGTGVAVGQSNIDCSVRVEVTMLVTKRVLVLMIRAVA
jgi:hypothetical protein